MNRLFRYFVAVLAVLMLTAGDAYGLEGSWRGELAIGQMKLPLVFNFTKSATGETQCTLDSPSQGAKGIPTQVLLCTDDSVSVSCAAIGMTYEGSVTPDGIKGCFKQRGYEFPLDLTQDAPMDVRRPQTPKPPFPYSVIDTTFTAQDGAVMSATLTIPLNASSRKMPAVVMVTGSGPQNRDEELMDHKPFAVIADYLARHGIASLRYDDRGTGKSKGNFLTATTYTFRDDAKSGIAFLRTISCIGGVGVLGHSEGGTIAFMLGADGEADFIVSLAGLAISGKEALLWQNSHALEQSVLSDAEKANSMKFINRLFDVMEEQGRKGESSPIDIDKLVKECGVGVPAQIIESVKMTQKVRTPWFDTLLAIDARNFLGKVKCPMLAINGDKDTQVTPDNLTVIKTLVPHADTKLMPGLNHLMQHAVTGEASEYDSIRETISPEVLEAIAGFIQGLERK